ncbi:MAG: helix-hairpin-helix domain-containing protein [Mycoplasmatales bacterium]
MFKRILTDNFKYLLIFIVCLLFILLSKDYTKQEVDVSTTSIVVDVKGSVNKPGVYELNEGSRLNNLINKAGGFKNANESCYNLARELKDQEQLIIKSSKEVCSSSSKININTANVLMLSSLPGIGESRAKQIINYRENNGNFVTIDEIKNISGIGEATFNNLKEYIEV